MSIYNMTDEEKLLCPRISLEERIRIADSLINTAREEVKKYETGRKYYPGYDKYYEHYRIKLHSYELTKNKLQSALFEEKIIKKRGGNINE